MIHDENFLEIHYDVVSFIEKTLTVWDGVDRKDSKIIQTYETEGQGGMYILAKVWTGLFQNKYPEEPWGETLDYHDTLDLFLEEKDKI